MKGYIVNLERLGHPESLNLAVCLILVSLRKEYDSFVQNYNIHIIGKTVNELYAMLKLHEQTLPKRDAPALAGKVQKKNKNKKLQLAARRNNKEKGKSKLFYAHKPKIPPPPKREDPTKDSVYDTGCRTHICNTTQGFKRSRKLKPRALSLYMGNGQRAAIKAIGSYDLCFPNGLVIVLHNFHYTPSITRGVILVSRLYDDGFINRFENDKSILVSKNNLIYFNAVPRDDIFEIVLSNSNINNSYMYVVSNEKAKLNLDSSLLWQCRLGHISKKRIEKLQRDGLLNSIHTKSFKKCVSCLSRKMARKPYSHQVERAKDLLGLIHTDGCEELVKRDTLTKHDKLEHRFIKCIFVGYPSETIDYSFYYPPENKVFVAQNAKFFENSLITQEASGSLEDLEIIQEEDMHPSENTSLHHDEDN
ncbi:zinc finger, CCHC-type containing protein [Tanacetum coccineum]